MKGKFALAVTLVLAISLAFAGMALARADKIGICHAKPADTAANGWEDIDISKDGTVLTSQHNTQHDADIIPAFSWTDNSGTHSFAGKNLATVWGGFTGAEILANGCTIPEANTPTPTATPVTPTATATATEEPPTPTETAVITEQPGDTPTPTTPPRKPPKCTSDAKIWVWQLIDANGNSFFLRDLGYDGTYDAPGVAQQCFYFGCDFKAVKAWGSWVTACDGAEYSYWQALPRYNGGGKCPLQ